MMFRKKKSPQIRQYDAAKQKPVIKTSICTGEKVAGFADRKSGTFEDVMLIRGEEDLTEFCRLYGIKKEEIGKIW